MSSTEKNVDETEEQDLCTEKIDITKETTDDVVKEIVKKKKKNLISRAKNN